MSVLIKGMKMPKEGCKDCPLVKRGNVFDICPFLKREVNGNVERGGKPYDCPLIELPDHGALIDKDALYEQTEEWEAQALAQVKEYCCGESSWEQNECRKWATIVSERSAFKFDVADAPVVIPAERSEE